VQDVFRKLEEAKGCIGAGSRCWRSVSAVQRRPPSVKSPPAKRGSIRCRAREVGVDFHDSSDAYGQGRNEELIASAVRGIRHNYVTASKFGSLRAADGSPTRQSIGRLHPTRW